MLIFSDGTSAARAVNPNSQQDPMAAVQTWQRGVQICDAAMALDDLNGFEKALFVTRYWFAEHVGVAKLYSYWEGVDPLTDRDLSDSARTRAGIEGVQQLIGSAVGIAGFGKMVAGKIASRGRRCPGDSCFVGNTQIVIGQGESTQLLAQSSPLEVEDNSSLAVLCLVVGTLSGVAVLKEEKRDRRRRHGPMRTTVNALQPESPNGGPSMTQSAELPDPDAAFDSSLGGLEFMDSDSSSCPSQATPVTSSSQSCGGTANSPPRKRGRIMMAVGSILSLLMGLWLWPTGQPIDYAFTPSASADVAPSDASPEWETVGEPATPKYKTVAIRDIRPAGYKVLADNPQTRGQAAGDFGEFDPKTWQVHRFLMTKPNGGWLKIGLARPVAWIESVERNDSGQVWLEFEELGIADWATLQGTEPCPSDILGEGRLVTGTFEHSSGEVLNLYIAGEATPIGSTANHPFWSEDRQDFVQAGSLNPGEQLRLADGRTTTLERTEPIAEQLPVYNLEVDGEHVYFVGESGVLVHNAGDPYRLPRLQPIHDTDDRILDHFRSRPTNEIVESLKPGAKESLKAFSDGRILNGHHRLKVLEERGIDIHSLPREIRDPFAGLNLPPGID